MVRSAIGDGQAAMAAALLSPDAQAAPPRLAGEAAARFPIYRNNFYHGLGEQLREAYPVVHRLVGDAFFAAAARLYIQAQPPRGRSLALFGGDFPAFLGGFPPAASVPYLADVARLERAWLEALHAADAPPLPPDEVTALGAGAASARLLAHPAARIVGSEYPVVSLWRANRCEEGFQPRAIPGRAEAALVTRPRHQVLVAALSRQEAAFAEALLAGEPASSAQQHACAGPGAFDLGAAFRRLLLAGAFAGIREGTRG